MTIHSDIFRTVEDFLEGLFYQEREKITASICTDIYTKGTVIDIHIRGSLFQSFEFYDFQGMADALRYVLRLKTRIETIKKLKG